MNNGNRLVDPLGLPMIAAGKAPAPPVGQIPVILAAFTGTAVAPVNGEPRVAIGFRNETGDMYIGLTVGDTLNLMHALINSAAFLLNHK